MFHLSGGRETRDEVGRRSEKRVRTKHSAFGSDDNHNDGDGDDVDGGDDDGGDDDDGDDDHHWDCDDGNGYD